MPTLSIVNESNEQYNFEPRGPLSDNFNKINKIAKLNAGYRKGCNMWVVLMQ